MQSCGTELLLPGSGFKSSPNPDPALYKLCVNFLQLEIFAQNYSINHKKKYYKKQHFFLETTADPCHKQLSVIKQRVV
jgi:hypothetical protein